ncbi:MAG: RnfABCDGE type electron transport complex subunit B [Candidatus Eisenbacteria sp.]|nr:RnfABCDGE type electron transport complex subunit B [Candidatus Eisenbacteria bacterium]
MTVVTVVLAAVVLAVLAVGMGYVLGWANRKFHVAVDPKVEALLGAMPGANCGGCGYVGCSEYAEALARGEAGVTLCAPGGVSTAEQLADIMGIEVDQACPYRAVLHCSAYEHQRLQRREYFGERTCGAANLVGGTQGCAYGCLGFGDCELVCDYDAIEMVDGLCIIDYEKCVGCGACVRACPRNIISMIPFKADRMLVVVCANKDNAREVKEVCEVGCSGCALCARKGPELFSMDGGLPIIDYEAYTPDHPDLEIAREKCPKKTLVFMGKPAEPESF